MIQPATCICMLLAAGSGLYLYETKHRTHVLDRRIEETMKQVETTRSRLGILQAEWALLNEPQRLAELGDKFLMLKPVAPRQFVTLTDLDRHLPAPLPPPAPQAAAETDEPDDPPQAAAAAAPASGAPSANSAATQANDAPKTAPEPSAPSLPADVALAVPPVPPKVPPTAGVGGHAAKELVQLASVPHAPPNRRESAAAEPRIGAGRRPTEPAEGRQASAAAERERPTASASHPKPPPQPVRPAAVVAASATPPPRVIRTEAVAVSARPPEPLPHVVQAAVVHPAAPASGSLLGGMRAVMAPPVPVADVVGQSR